jgi:Ca-activated chloride channel family protein
VLARRPVRTLAAEVTLSAPDEATGSSQVSIEWQGPGNNGDYITIVPRATADGKSAHYANISSGSTVKVIAPLDAGDAEIRYMSGQGAKVLGRRAIRIVAAKITMSAPPTAAAGATIAIAWTGPDNPGDYITIVPKGAADGTSGKYALTRNGSPANIGLPPAPGTCEIRYVDGATNRVLARAAIESR